MKLVHDTSVLGRLTTPEAEQPSEPKGPNAGTPPEPTDVEKLLALIARWQREPLGDEDETVAELDRTLREDPVRFHEPDLSD